MFVLFFAPTSAPCTLDVDILLENDKIVDYEKVGNILHCSKYMVRCQIHTYEHEENGSRYYIWFYPQEIANNIIGDYDDFDPFGVENVLVCEAWKGIDDELKYVDIQPEIWDNFCDD